MALSSSVMGKFLPALGLSMITAFSAIAIYFATSYQRFSPPSSPEAGISKLVSEVLYLLAKLAFLPLALAAGVQLLRIGVSKEVRRVD